MLPVLDYIKANLNQDLSIEHVAFCFGFSVRNLTRLFTNSGIRFVHYLNYLRIVRAIEILTDNAMNIEQTAYEVGFNSPNSFGRVFKQITGESPSELYKKALEGMRLVIICFSGDKYPAEISLFFIGKDYLCSRF